MPINFTESNDRKIYMWKNNSYFWKNAVTRFNTTVYRATSLSINKTPNDANSPFEKEFDFTYYSETASYARKDIVSYNLRYY